MKEDMFSVGFSVVLVGFWLNLISNSFLLGRYWFGSQGEYVPLIIFFIFMILIDFFNTVYIWNCSTGLVDSVLEPRLGADCISAVAWHPTQHLCAFGAFGADHPIVFYEHVPSTLHGGDEENLNGGGASYGGSEDNWSQHSGETDRSRV